MVTLTKEELESEKARVFEQKKKISQYRKEASDIASISIPERKYGSKITKANQDQYIKRRIEAQLYLKELDSKEKELDDYLNSLNTAFRDQDRKTGTRGGGIGSYIDTTKKDNSTGGYYMDEKTGLGYSSPYDLTKKRGYKRILSSKKINQGYYIEWSKPKPEFDDTQKSYSPKVIDLGKGLVIKVPEQKQVWKSAKFNQVQWSTLITSPYVAEKGRVTPQTYLAQRYITFSDYLGDKVINNKVLPLTDKSKRFLTQYNPKGYARIPFTEVRVLPSTFDVTSLGKAGLFYPVTMTAVEGISSLTPRNLARSRTTFKAEVENVGKFSKVNIISATEFRGRNVVFNGKVLRIPDEVSVSIGKSNIKNIGKDKAVGGSGLYNINSNKLNIDSLNIQRIEALSEIKDLGKARYVNSNSQYKLIRELGDGQVSKSLYKQTGEINVRRVLDLSSGKFRTITKKVKFNNEIQEGNIIAGFYVSVKEGSFKYFGYTNPVARIYKTGRKSLVLKDLNIKGDIRSIDITKERMGGGTLIKLTKSKTLPKAVQREISKQIGASIVNSNKNTLSKSITSEIIKTTAVKSTPIIKQSLYSGTGQYERTDSIASLITTITRTQTRNRFNIMQISSTNTGQRTRLRKLTSQIPKTNQISINRLETRQAQRFKIGTITKQKSIAKNPRININNINTGKGNKFTIALFKSKVRGIPLLKKITGYRAFSLKNGKRKYLTGVVSKGTAIRKGERFALLKKGKDIFGISKTAIKITGVNDNYTPNTKKFKSLPLKNIWIERGIKI